MESEQKHNSAERQIPIPPSPAMQVPIKLTDQLIRSHCRRSTDDVRKKKKQSRSVSNANITGRNRFGSVSMIDSSAFQLRDDDISGSPHLDRSFDARSLKTGMFSDNERGIEEMKDFEFDIRSHRPVLFNGDESDETSASESDTKGSKQKNVIISAINISQSLIKVRKTFYNTYNEKFIGFVVFLIRGKQIQPQTLNILKEQIVSIFSEYGIAPKYKKKHPNLVYCHFDYTQLSQPPFVIGVSKSSEPKIDMTEEVRSPTILFLSSDPLITILAKGKFVQKVQIFCQKYGLKLAQIDANTPKVECEYKSTKLNNFSPDVHRLVVNLPVISSDRAERIIRMNLTSGFNGFIRFQPEQGSYHKVLMKHYPKAIIDICKEYNYQAAIVDEFSQVVECQAIRPNSMPVSSPSPKQRIVVKLPSFNASQAEALIHKQLESKYRGIVIFEPEKEFYSQSLMKKYPQRIIEICREFGYNAHISNEFYKTVECDMTTNVEIVDTDNTLVVDLPNFDPKQAEAIIRNTLQQNYNGLVNFKPKFGSFSQFSMPKYPHRILEICNEYKFECTLKDSHAQIIECNMGRTLNHKQITIILPSTDKAGTESIIKKQLETDFEGLLIFKPSSNQYGPKMVGYPQRIVDICKSYELEADIFDAKRQYVQCHKKLGNEVMKLSPIDASRAEMRIRDRIRMGRPGTVDFVPEGGSYKRGLMPGFPHRVVEICIEIGCQAHLLDETRDTVRCYIPETITPVHSRTLSFNSAKPVETEEVIITPNHHRTHSTMASPMSERRVHYSATLTPGSPRRTKPSKTIIVSKFDHEKAEQCVIDALNGDIEGKILFVPEFGSYSQKYTPDFPIRILQMCEEQGFPAKLLEENQCVVECDLSRPKNLRETEKNIDQFIELNLDDLQDELVHSFVVNYKSVNDVSDYVTSIITNQDNGGTVIFTAGDGLENDETKKLIQAKITMICKTNGIQTEPPEYKEELLRCQIPFADIEE